MLVKSHVVVEYEGKYFDGRGELFLFENYLKSPNSDHKLEIKQMHMTEEEVLQFCTEKSGWTVSPKESLAVFDLLKNIRTL